MASGAWRDRVAAAQNSFRERVGGRGTEMHPRTHRAWVETNDAVNDLDRELVNLAERLRVGDAERAAETRSAIAAMLRRVAEAAARLRTIEM